MKKEPKLESIEDYKNEIKRLEKTTTIKNLIGIGLIILMIIFLLNVNNENTTIHNLLVIGVLITFVSSIVFFALSKSENNKIEEYKNKIEKIDTIKKAIHESKDF